MFPATLPTVPPLPICRFPPLIVVVPVYVFEPLRINAPPPLTLKEKLPLMPPATVNEPPLATPTPRLLPSAIGALIVLLPVSLIVAVPAVPAVLARVNVLAPDGLIT